MIVQRVRMAARMLAVALLFVLAGPTPSAFAVERPVKEILESELGWEVNANHTNICRTSTETCQLGERSIEPSGFAYPNGIATGPGPEHYVYVADQNNGRIQVFTPTGTFVEMFGWDVNKTKTEKGATQQEMDICTAAEIKASGVKCQAGQSAVGAPAGLIGAPSSIAVDEETGDFYVMDVYLGTKPNIRIEKYAPNGEFLLMIGGEVNKNGGNICLKSEEANCQAGKESAPGSEVAGAFKVGSNKGNLLAVGPKDTLYVGDEGRIQVFEHDGHLRDIPVPVKRVMALALGTGGALYVTGGANEGEYSPTVHKFDSSGAEVVTKCTQATPTCWPLTLVPVRKYAEKQIEGVTQFFITTLTADADGRLAVAEREEFQDASGVVHVYRRGLLLNGVSGEQITGFALLELGYTPTGMAFGAAESNGGYPLYAAGYVPTQVIIFKPVSAAAVSTQSSPCTEGSETETSVSMRCTLRGEVNPWGVPSSEAWFAWGPTGALGTETPKQTVCSATCGESPVAMQQAVTGLRPNEPIYYEVDAEDENVKAPEALASKPATFDTPVVAPRVSVPSVENVGSSSAIAYAEVNPENSSTTYRFAYGPCASGLKGCAANASSQSETSGIYGLVGTTEELTDLQPGTTYHYALYAENEAGQLTEGPEGSFTTGAAPLPSATATAADNVTFSSAILEGSVDPNDQTATYTFELGLYDGQGTSYGVVSFASIAPSGAPVSEQVTVSGLQAGATYVFRIKASNGYGEAISAPVMFTTPGLPAALGLPATPGLVEVPNITIPAQSSTKPRTVRCRRGYRRTRRNKCVKAKKRRKRAAQRPTRSSAGRRRRH